MGTTTYVIIMVVGAILSLATGYTLSKKAQRRSLTPWILFAMGVGIIVGGNFRYHATAIFDPGKPQVIGTVAAPFAFQGQPGATLTIRVDEMDPISVTVPGGDTWDALAMARYLDRQDPAGIKIGTSEGRIKVTGKAAGETSSITILEDGGGAARLGIATGTVRGSGEASSLIRDFHDFLRSLFLNALRMMIVPIIFTSIVSGMLSLGAGGNIGRIGMKTLGYYMMTSLLAIVVGLILVNVIQPGKGATIELADKPQGFEENASKTTSEFLFDFFLNLIPSNPIAAMAEGKILQIITFALLIGFFITRLEPRYRTVLTDAFEGLFQTMMRIVRLLLWLAPVGVYAIFVKVIAETGPSVFADLGWYALAVFVGLVIHASFTLPMVMRFVGRLSPYRHFRAMTPALLTAFSTSSSAATLPLTIRCVEDRVGVSNRTSSFVLPLGATVNMDGTALYECVAAIFIAQIYVTQGVIDPLTAGQQFLVVFTALAASIGAAGVPMAGMVMLGIILKALGLPLEGVGYVLAVDRLLDMCRTMVNIWSDSVGCAIIAKSEGETEVLTRWPLPGIGDEEPKAAAPAAG